MDRVNAVICHPLYLEYYHRLERAEKERIFCKTTIITNVQTRLFELQDLKYRDFHAKLMPTVNKEKIIGVRTPALRVFAKKYGKTDEAKE